MATPRPHRLALAAVALLCACSRSPETSSSGAGSRHPTVTVDGSSTVFPITEAVAEDFQKSTPGVRVIVGISGTGGGFKKFCNGEIDVLDASRPIKPVEVEYCQQRRIEYIELPIAYDGLVVLVSLKNTWAKHVTTDELKKIWEPEAQGRVTRWSDVRVGWPDRPLRLYGPGVDSGTYDYFTEAIVKKEHASRGDFTSSEDDNVVAQGIATDAAALGYFGYAYYAQNKEKFKLLAVDDNQPENGQGPIEPSPETLRAGTYQPLSRPIFIYVSARALARSDVAAFTSYYLSHVARLSAEVGYIPLPERAYTLARDRLDRRVTGSLFGGNGVRVGVSIQGLLEKEGG